MSAIYHHSTMIGYHWSLLLRSWSHNSIASAVIDSTKRNFWLGRNLNDVIPLAGCSVGAIALELDCSVRLPRIPRLLETEQLQK